MPQEFRGAPGFDVQAITRLQIVVGWLTRRLPIRTCATFECLEVAAQRLAMSQARFTSVCRQTPVGIASQPNNSMPETASNSKEIRYQNTNGIKVILLVRALLSCCSMGAIPFSFVEAFVARAFHSSGFSRLAQSHRHAAIEAFG